MLSQPSESRHQLMEWVKEITDWITFDSVDRAYLDDITAAEVIDLAYIDGADISEAIAAHALSAPTDDEGDFSAAPNSSFSVSFPIRLEEQNWGYDIKFRAARPSILGIGWANYFPRVNLDPLPPDELLSPKIRGVSYKLREDGGDRLRLLAGPISKVEYDFSIEGDEPLKRNIMLKEETDVLSYVETAKGIKNAVGEHGLEPISDAPKKFESFSLRLLRGALKIEISSQIERYASDEAKIFIEVKLLASGDSKKRGGPRERILSSLILPHMFISLRGATAELPTQQYEETKEMFLSLSEDDRRSYANHRLYAVRQSGCVATSTPYNKSQVALTTFGLFDTPRDQPVPGPEISKLIENPDTFISQFSNPSPVVLSFIQNNWDVIRNIIKAAGNAFNIQYFHKFQWDAITTGIYIEAEKQHQVVTIIRAPTGAGKTIVFMVNAAISSLCSDQRSTSVLLFPTRLLNEDMFRRLTSFTHQMRLQMPEKNITGGLLIGTSDPFYKLLLEPEEDEILYHFGYCPACHEGYLRAETIETGKNTVPICEKCRHVIDYMYSPKDVANYLPDIIIATPDKLFYEATVAEFEMYGYGLFGAPVRRCIKCGKAHSAAQFLLKPDKKLCKDIFRGSDCDGVFSTEVTSKPIRYMGFDEVHSLYGQTVTYLSVFLATLEAMQRVLADPKLSIRYETATATIANERELLEAITRRYDQAKEIIAIPNDHEFGDYFEIDSRSVRHRVVITMPTLDRSSRSTTVRALLNAFMHISERNPDLKQRLRANTSRADAWDFLMGYVFKIQDGYDFKRSLTDHFQNIFDEDLNVEFLSGKSPKNQVSRIIEKARSGEIDILLANLVVSLGIDISGLNHMIMFGVPGSFTEYVQTAGRTGRGKMSGHVNIILLPVYPRDNYLYRHFHAVFSDVAGYYDALPVRSTNLHCSEMIFGNVVHAIIAALCIQKPAWTNAQGFSQVVDNRDKQLLGAISNLLCDVDELRKDTNELVFRRYKKLRDDMLQQSKFLGNLLKNQDEIAYSLRGNFSKNVKVVCSDDDLLELMLDTFVAPDETVDED